METYVFSIDQFLHFIKTHDFKNAEHANPRPNIPTHGGFNFQLVYVG